MEYFILTPKNEKILLDYDYFLLFKDLKVRLDKDGYPRCTITIPGLKSLRYVAIHQIILMAKGKVVDHINGNKLDNRSSNLRLCTTKENSRNRKKNSDNTSGYKGVTFHKPTKKWQSQLKYKGKTIYLGLFFNKEDAAKAYDKAAKLCFGKFANTNEDQE